MKPEKVMNWLLTQQNTNQSQRVTLNTGLVCVTNPHIKQKTGGKKVITTF